FGLGRAGGPRNGGSQRHYPDIHSILLTNSEDNLPDSLPMRTRNTKHKRAAIEKHFISKEEKAERMFAAADISFGYKVVGKANFMFRRPL
ncbi:hypothetical protein ACTHUR_15750, partial [Neisseria sp. P0021.S007]|uniref:hypothetical protein n=1 Tax=Neisseria sp. P0021.S007 TaxID=3436822 RepID=UPI003F7D253B